MTRKTNKNTIHVPIWSTQIIMKSYWIVCILNNWGNDSKVSIWTWSEHLNAIRSTVGSSQLDSDGWRVSRHTSGRAPEAKPWTNERPDIFARASWARRGTQRGSGACARFPTVNRCLSVMRCPQPSCAGKRWPTSTVFSRFWPKFVGLRRPPPPYVVGCVSGVQRSDRRFCVYVCVGHVIQTRDRGVFVLHGCYQERKTAEKRRILLFHAFRGRQFYHRGTQSWAAGGVVKRSLAAGRPIHQLKDERRLWSFVRLIGSLDVCCLKRADRIFIWAFCSLFLWWG